MYNSTDEATIRKYWFPRHEGTLLAIPNNPVNVFSPRENLIWSKPGSSMYRVDYLVYGHHLVVVGDLGEAVYGWSERVTLEWIAKLDLDYFAGKCEASEKGRHYVQWSKEKAFDLIQSQWLPNFEGDAAGALEEFNEVNGGEAIEDYHSWCRWLSDDCSLSGIDSELHREDNGTHFFGCDWTDGIPNIGEETDIRCRAHLLGLRMAFLENRIATQETKETA